MEDEKDENKEKEKEKEIEIGFEFLKLFFNIELINIHVNFGTDLLIKDILELKTSEEVYDKLLKFDLSINGLTMNNKLLFKSLLDTFEKNDKIKELNLSKLITYFQNALYNNKTFVKLMNENKKDIIDLFEKLNIYKHLQSNITLFLKELQNDQYIHLADGLNFEELEISFLFPIFGIGFNAKVVLKGLNEVIKKEVFEKIKVNEKEQELLDKIIEDNELNILKKFREDYKLKENEYSNEKLIKILRKKNYDFPKSFNALFK